jgi:hypothetical protein
MRQVDEPDALVLAAATATGDTAALEAQAAAWAGASIPLAAWPADLEELGRAAESAANGLIHASELAVVILGPDPALPYPGAVPSALGVASARAATAASDVSITRDAISRELRRTGAAPGTGLAPLGSHATRAGQSLRELADTLQAAITAGDARPDVLIAVLEQQALALGAMSRALGRLFPAVTATCEHMPGAAAWRTTRAASPVRRASATLGKAAAVTTHARGHLADELARRAVHQ